ncbi:MAG: protein translocase subunit SecD [bacterium]|nr:protein translocase subunit SecD [bacterium]
MKQISWLRIWIIIAVTVISVVLVIPTARYYWNLRHEVQPTSPEPAVTGPAPAAQNTEAYAAWKAQNPQWVAWSEKNQAYLAWEKKTEQLRLAAIPLGLDLIGGVDVTLMLDREKAMSEQVNELIASIKRDLDNAKITANLKAVPGQAAFVIELPNREDARNAANRLNEYVGRDVISGKVSESDLRSGKPVTVELNALEINKQLVQDLEGTKKRIADRVDALGVTQPRIALQGADQIRIQVPGEKDPDKLINTVIQPAFLEFRLVDKRMNQIIGADGKPLPGVTIPVGTEIKSSKIGHIDESTGQLVYTTSDYLLESKDELTGADLRSANVSYVPSDFQNPIQVSLEFNPAGTRKFADVTSANVGTQLAILLDGVVRSAPVLQAAITDGRAVITGGFSQEEATELSQVLKAGSLKAPLKIESKRTVGATTGAESIKDGVKALYLGAVVITVFMIAYYGTAGVISVVALALNILIILAIMSLAKATLTLSGIGGILLTIGMAVDANVLIYERIREEVKAGRPLGQAIGLGFARAFNVIFDSNLTTLLSALVLLQFTEGSVFGFALTMTFGLLANLFTGLTVTYTLCALWFARFGHLSLGRLSFFPHSNFDFIKARHFSWSGSTLVLIVGLILVIARGGLQMGVDFEGGSRAEVQFAKPTSEVAIRDAMTAAGLQDPNVQPVTDRPNYYIIDVKLLPVGTKVKTVAAAGQTEAAEKTIGQADQLEATEARVEQGLRQAFPGTNAFTIALQSGFGAQSGQAFSKLALWVVCLGSMAIMIYLAFRFEPVFGVAAVVALLHDLLIVVVLGSLWNVQITLDVVAALMVLMGFSVNDTIVIFDRIRENTRTMFGKSFGEICNLAMNQSLSRTILTSGTVFAAVLCLYFIGGEGLRSFAKVYLLGTITGTFSSDFIAAPLVYQWNKYKGNRLQMALAAKKKKVEKAQPVRSAGAATRPNAYTGR